MMCDLRTLTKTRRKPDMTDTRRKNSAPELHPPRDRLCVAIDQEQVAPTRVF